MKNIKILLSLFILINTSAGFADQIDVLFVPNSESEVKISGHLNPVENNKIQRLTATSENASKVYTIVKEHMDKGFSGFIDARIINQTSQDYEDVEFQGNYQDGTGIFYVYAHKNDGTVIRWEKPKD